MCVGFAIVSMVGTNFHDTKLIKSNSAPGPNEIGPQAQMRSCAGPEPFFFLTFFLNKLLVERDYITRKEKKKLFII